MMEENNKIKEKKIDKGLIAIILLLGLIGVLSFYLIAQNTGWVYKTIRDENISIKVPYSFEAFNSIEASETEKDNYLQYYYIHKVYGLNAEEVLDVLLNDQLYHTGEYSEIYTSQIDGYEVVQYNYLHLDHSSKISGFFYTEGLMTVVEMDNRFLVIDVFKKIDLETGENMSLGDIELDSYNEIMESMKINDHTTKMQEPDDIQINFGDLEFTLPGYWRVYSSSKVNIHFINRELFSAYLEGHAIQETENSTTEYYISAKENMDIYEDVEYLGEYKMDEENFTVFMIDNEYIVALSDRYWFRIDLSIVGEKYMVDEKTQQALIDILFNEN